MTRGEWRDALLGALKPLASAEYQQRVWVRGEGPEVSGPDEPICQLFDDTGLADQLEDGTAHELLGDAVVSELTELLRLTTRLPETPVALLLTCEPTWAALMASADRAIKLLVESDGA